MFQITHKKQSMQVDQFIQKFHGKWEVNPTKFDLHTVNGQYSSPSILRYIFHIKPHFSKKLL